MTRSDSAPDSIPVAARIEGAVARTLAHLPGAWLLRLSGERPHVVDGLTLDPHVQFILAAQRRRPNPGLCQPTPVDGRLRNRREVRSVAPTPTPVATVRDITVDGAAGPLPARHYAPMAAGNRPAPLLVYLHGGGFVIGDLDTHDEPCRLLCCHAAMHVVSVAYRLAPEHPFPCAVEDSIAALRWAQQHAGTLGADPAAVCVGGDSAGGNLSAVASLALAREGRAPAAMLLIYPATDVAAATASLTRFGSGYVLEQRDMRDFMRYYLGTDPPAMNDPRVSPLRATDLALSPPALVLTAGFDPLRDEGNAFADALRAAGVTVQSQSADGLVHGFLHMTAVVPSARHAVIDAARAFRQLLERTGAKRIDSNRSPSP